MTDLPPNFARPRGRWGGTVALIVCGLVGTVPLVMLILGVMILAS